MDLQYIDYSIEELADNRHFIAWVLRNEYDEEWKALIDKYPDFVFKAEKARELVHLLHEKEGVTDEKVVQDLWQNIEHYDRSQKKKRSIVLTRRLIYLAASILLVLALGIMGYNYFTTGENSFSFASGEVVQRGNITRIILADGEKIALKKNNSQISLSKDHKLVIDNDSIIDLSGLLKARGKKGVMNEIVVPYGRSSVLHLADGTEVWLNAGTRFAFPSDFRGRKRQVILEGEAYFEVARDTKKPFIVRAGEVNVKVLGTRFNISAYANDARIETILLEGSVTMSKHAGRSTVVLKPYQKASFDKKNKKVTVTDEPDAGNCISWTKGWLQFSHENLQVVFKKLERYYNVDIVTPGNFKYSQLISGKLDIKKSLDEVMTALADVAKIDYHIRGKTIYIEQD